MQICVFCKMDFTKSPFIWSFHFFFVPLQQILCCVSILYIFKEKATLR